MWSAHAISNTIILLLIVIINNASAVLENAVYDKANNSRFPRKGDVEFMCSGPPCQGHSRLNSFCNGDNALVNNAKTAACQSYLNFYRSKFFLMENVQGMFLAKNGTIFKPVSFHFVLSEKINLLNAIAHICSAKSLMEKVANFVRQNCCTLVETAAWKDQSKRNPKPISRCLQMFKINNNINNREFLCPNILIFVWIV